MFANRSAPCLKRKPVAGSPARSSEKPMTQRDRSDLLSLTSPACVAQSTMQQRAPDNEKTPQHVSAAPTPNAMIFPRRSRRHKTKSDGRCNLEIFSRHRLRETLKARSLVDATEARGTA